MNLQPRGLPTALAALALALVFGCEARVDSRRVADYVPILRQDLKLLVLDRAKQPISGATVRLYRKLPNGALFLASATTDANGQVIFPEPDLGQYLVTASKSGYIMNSTFAIVDDGSIIASDLILSPVLDLIDRVRTDVPQSGGTATTLPVPGVSQSAVTFAPGSLAGDAQVIIGTLIGQQIPVTPPGQVALNAVLVEANRPLTGQVTFSLGLPLDLPEGATVPVYAFDEATNQWRQIATGTVQGDHVVALLDSIGTVSALASFIPRRTTIVPSVEILSRLLGPSDGPVIEFTWTPRLTFPEGTNYPDRTKNWFRGTLEQIIGYKIDEPVVTKITRDPNVAQTLRIYKRVDRYTLTVFFGAGKLARGAGSTDVSGDVTGQDADTEIIWHSSGFGGGG